MRCGMHNRILREETTPPGMVWVQKGGQASKVCWQCADELVTYFDWVYRETGSSQRPQGAPPVGL